jgi:hypothetical protein
MMRMPDPRRVIVWGSGIGKVDDEGPPWVNFSSKNVNAQMESSMELDVIPLRIEYGVCGAYGKAGASMVSIVNELTDV